MKFEFGEVPTIGTAIVIDGQRFDLIRIDPHHRQDGSATQLLVWHSDCPVCAVPFVGKSPEKSMPQTRRCEHHRQSGKPVGKLKD